MKDVLLTFHAGVDDDRQREILAEVERWPGVATAAPLKRDAVPQLRRFSYARVDEKHAAGVTRALKDLPEVEKAEEAPRRG
ncbi:hypothetical protein [uncultured Methylobacterium sp.]|jgi:hypothetical protein|uniref:hypothetical protein n=1 Tax=uncultured Methylobacterium sp. TaxID=157278 RepID=UPI00261EDA30|nr:hypothetical protein [uncultured Methylobacterium sp.]